MNIWHRESLGFIDFVFHLCQNYKSECWLDTV